MTQYRKGCPGLIPVRQIVPATVAACTPLLGVRWVIAALQINIHTYSTAEAKFKSYTNIVLTTEGGLIDRYILMLFLRVSPT